MTGISLHAVTSRPTWRGRIVPYITVWSGEQIDLTKRPLAYVTNDDGAEYLSFAHTEVSALAAGRALLERRDGFSLLGSPAWTTPASASRCGPRSTACASRNA